MKLFHLSDLHLGKRVNEFNMLEEQDHILRVILQLIDAERPDAALIAGDVYDKAVPAAEAVQLFDRFLCRLARRNVPVFLISGNHDSPERLAFASTLLQSSGVYISPVHDGAVRPIELHDAFGSVRIYLLPFLKPAHVRRFFPEAEIGSYTDALRTVIEQMAVDRSVRNLLVTHQFVTGAERCESEELSVGGSDNVSAAVFDDFDYVALGHLHGPQSVGRETLRYCGSPLKYSFSEAGQEKSVTVVELLEKGDVRVRTLPLTPRHDLREIRGTYMELMALSTYQGTATDDYLHITLTDEEDIPDAVAKLRVIYPNLMKLDYDNARTRRSGEIAAAEEQERKTPLELFEELYEKQNNRPLGEEQRGFARDLIETIWEGAE